jgi:hypothetical protein
MKFTSAFVDGIYFLPDRLSSPMFFCPFKENTLTVYPPVSAHHSTVSFLCAFTLRFQLERKGHRQRRLKTRQVESSDPYGGRSGELNFEYAYAFAALSEAP